MLIIRADGNAKIGVGHLMRCLTIAGEIQGEVVFFCADEASAKLVTDHGFRAKVFHTDYQKMEDELEGPGHPTWEDFITEEKLTILVDSYYVTDRYLEQLRKYGRVVLLDDMQQQGYLTDGIINYNVFADEARYEWLYRDIEQGKKIPKLLGGQYIPLRKQFQNTEYCVRDAVQHVLITTGGSDPGNIAIRILERIIQSDIIYHIIVGPFSPAYSLWKKLAEEQNNICIHYDVQDMASLMKQCDLAITAGGSTVYELSAIGVPLICFSYAENQEALVNYFLEKNIAGSAGAWHLNQETCLTKIGEQFRLMCEDIAYRTACSRREHELVDGLGAGRIARALEELF